MAVISTQSAMRALILLAALCSARLAWAAECVAHSGERTAALVELYTAQRCSGCPAANRWLSVLGKRFGARVVPLSLHVDGWEYLRPMDPSVEARSSRRERNLLLLQRMALVYTPQVMLQGREFRDWASIAFDRELERVNARPPAARLTLEIRAAAPGTIVAVVEGEVLDPAQRGDAALYLAAFQDRASSTERRSVDRVVREWLGPISMGVDGRIAEARRLDLLPAATPETSGVAAFVQNRRTGDVLQALLLSACSP